MHFKGSLVDIPIYQNIASCIPIQHVKMVGAVNCGNCVKVCLFLLSFQVLLTLKIESRIAHNYELEGVSSSAHSIAVRLLTQESAISFI